MTHAHSLAGVALAASLFATPTLADICDYKPSKLVGEAMTGAATVIGGGAAAAGVGMKAAGFYTLVHSTSGLTMLGSTAAGASAAGTTGIIAGSAGVGAAIASVLMAPVTIVAGALTVVVVGGYEGACYFQIERVDEPSEVLAILESIAKNDPSIEIVDIEAGRAIQLDREGGEESYLIENLYIADGDLMHRDRFLNTNLGPVVFVEPSAKPD